MAQCAALQRMEILCVSSRALASLLDLCHSQLELMEQQGQQLSLLVLDSWDRM